MFVVSCEHKYIIPGPGLHLGCNVFLLNDEDGEKEDGV